MKKELSQNNTKLTIAFHRNNMNSYISISGIIKETDRETYLMRLQGHQM